MKPTSGTTVSSTNRLRPLASASSTEALTTSSVPITCDVEHRGAVLEEALLVLAAAHDRAGLGSTLTVTVLV